MKRKFILMWLTSMLLYGVSAIAFFNFMFKLNTTNLARVLLLIAAATVMYLFSSKKLVHPKGFTYLQAVIFYKACKKAELNKPEQCRKKTVKFKEVAECFEFSKKLNENDLYLMFEEGYKIYNRKEDKK